MLLPIAFALSSCSAGGGATSEDPAANAEKATAERPHIVWGETDSTRLTRLGAAEIRAALLGKMVGYSPPGWADAGSHEEYHGDGRWTGTRLSRGPIPFSGRWHVDDARLCVVAESGMVAGALKDGPLCRTVWLDRKTGALLMEDAMSQGRGLLILSVRAIPAAPK